MAKEHGCASNVARNHADPCAGARVEAARSQWQGAFQLNTSAMHRAATAAFACDGSAPQALSNATQTGDRCIRRHFRDYI
jgi:Na+-translocating ferredoxin:NAD+ oxidoreductase RnfG subunit